MIFALVLAVVACANAASVGPQCTVGEWSAWSECVASRQCYNRPLVTYVMKATAEWDAGRDAMQTVMARKNKEWEATARCKADGTCPEKMMMPLGGSYTCNGNIAGDIPCDKIDQLSFLTFAQMGYNSPVPGDNNPAGNDVWGWTDTEFNNDEYAIMGFTGGTAFVRVTDPRNPVPVGFMYTATVSSSWRDIKVIGNHAYIVSEAANHGLQVFDLRRLRGRTTIEYFQPDAVNTQFGNAHNIVANEELKRIYVVGATRGTFPNICRGGLMIFDVSNPVNPVFDYCYGDDGYVHDAQCVVYRGPDVEFRGRDICFCYNEDSLTIVDVAARTMIAKNGYVNVAYTHQGWVTEDHEVILLDDEQDELGSNKNTKTYLWDIRNLRQPALKHVFQAGVQSIDHNQYIIGDYTFQGNYESGLRILHIDREREVLTQAAYFDVYPARTAAEFNGAWSVYPYFSSGNVLISSINHGLFVVSPRWSEINEFVKSGQTAAEQTRVRGVLAAQRDATCPILSESRICSASVLC